MYPREYDVQLREPVTTSTTEYYVEPSTEAPVYVEPEPAIIEPSPPAYIEPTPPCNCNNVASEPIVVAEEPAVAVYYPTTTPQPVYETEPPVSYEPVTQAPCDKTTTEYYVPPAEVVYSDVTTQAPALITSYDSPLTAYSPSEPSYNEPKAPEAPAARPVVGYTASYGFPGPYLSMAYGYGYPNVMQQPCAIGCPQPYPQQQLMNPFLVLLPMWYQANAPVTPNNVIPPAYAPTYSYDNALPTNIYDNNNNKPAYSKYSDDDSITSLTSSSSDNSHTETTITDLKTKPAISDEMAIILKTLFYPRKQLALHTPSGFTPFRPSPFLTDQLTKTSSNEANNH